MEPGRPARRWLWASVAAGAAFAVWRFVEALTGAPYPEPPADTDSYALAPVLLVMFVPYAMAVREARRAGAGPLPAWPVVAIVAVHAVLAALPTGGSRDIYQYLFYGRMLAEHGANPHVVPPAVFAGDPWFGFITWHGQPSVYGPVWTAASAGAAATGSLTAAFLTLKAVILALDLAVIAALWRISPTGRTAVVVAWALNPLVLSGALLEGHADVAIAAALLGAVVATRRGRDGTATALLALAALVKAYAGVGLLVHLAVLARRRGGRAGMTHAAGAAALGLLAYLPFLDGWRTFSGAGEVAGRFGGTSLAGALYRLVTGDVGVVTSPGAVGAAILVVGAVAVLAALGRGLARAREDPWPWVALVLGTYLLVSPWSFPWHLLPLVALACAYTGSWWSDPVLVASATSLAAFRLPAYRLGLALQTAVRYGPPLALLTGRLRTARGSGARTASPPGRP